MWVSGLVLVVLTLAVAVARSPRYYFPDGEPPRFPQKQGYFFLPGSRNELLQRLKLADPRSVPKVDYGGRIGCQVNCTTLAQQILEYVGISEYFEAQERIQTHLDYLLDYGELTGQGNLVYPFHFDWEADEEKAPWYSAMTQGLCASAFLWGFRLLGDERYLVAAKQSVLAMAEEGNRFGKRLKKGIWLKEYPNYTYCVLDGSLTAIAGVFDCYRMLPVRDPDRETVKGLLDEALVGFKENAPHYRSRLCGQFFSDACEYPTYSYHRYVLCLLDYLSYADPGVSEILKGYSVRSFRRLRSIAASYAAGFRRLRLLLRPRKARVG